MRSESCRRLSMVAISSGTADASLNRPSASIANSSTSRSSSTSSIAITAGTLSTASKMIRLFRAL